jgi:hypothetical protein
MGFMGNCVLQDFLDGLELYRKENEIIPLKFSLGNPSLIPPKNVPKILSHNLKAYFLMEV